MAIDVNTPGGLRLQRRILNRLAQSDWTQLADSGLTATEQTEWNNYRTTLRGLLDSTRRPEVELANFPDEPNIAPRERRRRGKVQTGTRG